MNGRFGLRGQIGVTRHNRCLALQVLLVPIAKVMSKELFERIEAAQLLVATFDYPNHERKEVEAILKELWAIIEDLVLLSL